MIYAFCLFGFFHDIVRLDDPPGHIFSFTKAIHFKCELRLSGNQTVTEYEMRA